MKLIFHKNNKSFKFLKFPKKFNLIELGPGRGALINDITRVLNALLNKDTKYTIHFNEINKFYIQNLKNIGNPPTTNEVTDEPTNTMDTTPPPIDGETCMHGNSWHSNCSDCDDLDDYEVVLNEFEHLIKTTPNDKELGKKIRDFYNKWIELNEDNSDNTNNIDI